MRNLLRFLFIFAFIVGGVLGVARADSVTQDLGRDDLPAAQVGFSGDMESSLDSLGSSGSVQLDPWSDGGLLLSSSLMSVSPVEPSDDGSLKSLLLTFIGTYDPIVLEHEYTSGNGYTSVLREVQIDYPWLASCALLLVVIYCFFRTLGNIFGGSRK